MEFHSIDNRWSVIVHVDVFCSVQVKNLSNDFLDKHKDTIESVQGTVSHIGEKVAKSVDKMHRKLRKHGAHWFKSDQNNNEYAYQDHHSNSHARTRRREYSPGDGLHVNPGSANEKPQFEDKPNHKQKQSNHEQVKNTQWLSNVMIWQYAYNTFQERLYILLLLLM